MSPMQHSQLVLEETGFDRTTSAERIQEILPDAASISLTSGEGGSGANNKLGSFYFDLAEGGW